MSSRSTGQSTSGTAIGAVSIVWGILALIAVTVRLVLVQRRAFRLKDHDWYIILTLIGVLALCVFASIAGLSNVLITRDLRFVFNGLNFGANEDGVAAFTIIRIYCSLMIWTTVELFYRKFCGLKKAKSLIESLLSALVGVLYGLVLGAAIAALIRNLPRFLAGFMIFGTVVDLVITLGLLIAPHLRRRQLRQMDVWAANRSLIGITGIVSIFVLAAAIVQLVFTIQYGLAVFRSPRSGSFDDLVTGIAEYNATSNLTLWGVLYAATWTVLACLPTFSPNIQSLANGAKGAPVLGNMHH